MKNDWDGTEVVTHETNVLDAAQFTKLRSEGFTVATERAQCLGLVNEAWNKSRLPHNANLKAYVVVALERSLRQTEIPGYRTALSFFMNAITDERVDPLTRKDLADKTLFLVSFFDGSIRYRHYMASRESLVNIGISLYDSLWRMSDEADMFRPVFRQMADHFMQVVMVLQHVAPQGAPRSFHALREDLLMPSAAQSVKLARDAFELYYMHLVPGGTAQ